MESSTGLVEAFQDFGKDFGEGLKQERIKRLSDDKVDYKRSTLLTLVRTYPTVTDAVKAGYPIESIENAVKVLREKGYTVDLGRSYIEKN